jgi:hypothetical protein
MIHDLILKMSSCECCFHSLWCSCVYGLSLLLVRREVRTLLFERGTRTPTPTLTGRCSSTCGTTMNAGHTNACCARAQASLQWVAKINALCTASHRPLARWSARVRARPGSAKRAPESAKFFLSMSQSRNRRAGHQQSHRRHLPNLNRRVLW